MEQRKGKGNAYLALKQFEGRGKPQLMRLQLPPVHFIHPFMVVGVRVQHIVVIHCYQNRSLQSNRKPTYLTQKTKQLQYTPEQNLTHAMAMHAKLEKTQSAHVQ